MAGDEHDEIDWLGGEGIEEGKLIYCVNLMIWRHCRWQLDLWGNFTMALYSVKVLGPEVKQQREIAGSRVASSRALQAPAPC